MKGLYRRGQALAALGRTRDAVTDLEAALKLAANDPKQHPLIAEKLQAAKQTLATESTSGSGSLPGPSAAGGAATGVRDADGEVEVVEQAALPSTSNRAPAATKFSTVVIEEAGTEEEVARPAAPAASAQKPSTRGAQGGGGWGSPSGMPDMDPAQLRMAADMLSSNPDLLKQVWLTQQGMSALRCMLCAGCGCFVCRWWQDKWGHKRQATCVATTCLPLDAGSADDGEHAGR